MYFFKSINKSSKFITGILIFSFFIPYFSFPQKTEAQWVVIDPTLVGIATGNLINSTSLSVKEYIGDGLFKLVANIMIKKMTASTVKWINSGFKGNPTFVTDPAQFFGDIGDQVASDFLTKTDLNVLCSPFQAKVRLAITKSYIAEKDTSQNYSCTLSKIKDNYEGFMNDFGQGGWDAWFEITQNAQNNPYGAYGLAKNELDIRVGNQQNKYQKQADLGVGFLNQERCKSGKQKYKQSGLASCQTDYQTCMDRGQNTEDEHLIEDIVDQCNIELEDCRTMQQADDGTAGADCLPQDKETVTPGTVINDQLKKSLGTTWEGLNAADEINEVIVALFQQLITQVMGGVNGLLGAGGKDDTGSLADQIGNDTDAENKQLRDVTGDPGGSIDKPTITLNGITPMGLTVGDSFIDPGAKAFDIEDGNISVTSTSDVDTSKAGTYYVRYSATNLSGASATPVVRTVIVTEKVDNTIPVIQLVGVSEIEIFVNSVPTFTDQGATAFYQDALGSPVIVPVTGTGTVNTQIAGTYTISYDYISPTGKTAKTVTRTVVVK